MASVFFSPVLHTVLFSFNLKFLFFEVGPHRVAHTGFKLRIPLLLSYQVLLFTWTNYAWHLSFFTRKRKLLWVLGMYLSGRMLTWSKSDPELDFRNRVCVCFICMNMQLMIFN